MSGVAQARARAARFVAEHGDEAERARAAVLAGGSSLASAEPALARWAERSGVFPATGGVDPVAALPVLRALADLRGLAAPLALRIAEALARAQADDGSFGRAQSDEEERIYTTGRLAACLAGLRSVRRGLLERAADHLAARFTPERVGGFAWRPLAAYTPLFCSLEHERSDDVLQWCGRELERGFRERRFDAVQAARIFVDCDALALPGAKLAAPELRLALLAQQAADGSWGGPAGAGADARPAHALDGLAALVRLA